MATKVDHVSFDAIVNLGLDVVGRRYFPILRDGRDNLPLHREPFYHDLDDVFGAFHANPSDDQRKERFRLLYVCAVTNEHNVRPLMPSNRALESFKESLIQVEENGKGHWPVVVVGKRGSGKTAAINYVLTMDHEELQRNHVTWLRADIAKLHVLNQERVNTIADHGDPNFTDKIYSLTYYLELHAFMVILSFAKDKVFGDAFGSELNHETSPSPFEDRLRKIDESLALAWQSIRKVERERSLLVKKNPIFKSQDHDLKWYFKELTGISEQQCHKIFVELWKFVTEKYESQNNGISPRLILVVDGVDNIRHDEHAPASKHLGGRNSGWWFKRYCDQLREYVTLGGGCAPHNKCVFAIRDDTEKEFFYSDSNKAQLHEIVPSLRKYEVGIPDFEELFRKKFEYAKHSNTHCDSTNTPGGKSERLDLFGWFYVQFVAQHVSKLTSRVARPANRALTVADVIEITFNGNVRNFCRNLVRAFDYLYSFATNHTDYSIARDAAERREVFYKTSQLIFEGSILSGNSYMLDNDTNRAEGRWCPNFFEFLATDAHRWDGLTLFRVLQALPASDSGLPSLVRTGLTTALESLGYHARVVEDAIYVGLEYGLISLGARELVTSTDKWELTLAKTRKGGFVADLLFSDAPSLYLVATGARFCDVPNLAESPSSFESPYIHRRKSPRYFYASTLRTVVHLLRHIVSAHKRDMMILDTNQSLRENGPKDPQIESILRRFVAPDLSLLFSDLESIVRTEITTQGEIKEFEGLNASWEALLKKA